jgi:hypothetical protein
MSNTMSNRKKNIFKKFKKNIFLYAHMVNREYRPPQISFSGGGVFELKHKKESPIVLDRILNT